MIGASLATLRVGSITLAAIFGFALAAGLVRLSLRWRLRQAVMGEAGRGSAPGTQGASGAELASAVEGSRRTVAEMVTRAMELRSRALAMGMRRPLTPAWLVRNSGTLERSVAHAGLSGKVSVQGLWDCSLLAAALFGLVGCLLGCAVSAGMGAVGAVVGVVAGARLPRAILENAVRSRASDLERSLSQMLEVVALGLRSGLSFDSALALYSAHFCCPLAQGLAAAQSQWEFGLATREQALRSLSDSYDSILFGRVVESIVRSIRFGSSLANNLDDAASEARSHYRTARQESVAKAPVKMMLPTSTLILPAMLILVLGPVLLELMG